MGKGRLLAGGSLCLLLLLVLLPADASATAPEPQYLVLVPFLIPTDTPEKVCVQLSHLNESVTLSLTLDYGQLNQSLAREEVAQEEAFRCISFQVPKRSGNPEALLTVLVEGPTLHFWSRKRILVKDLENLVFVQTDKPIYKPGQLVQFRIVSLSEDFKPVDEQFPLVYIKDPKRNRLAQWRDVELPGGLVQLSFPLTSEPAQGSYMVVVQTAAGRNVEHSFVVQEYVLPKYEVTIKAPKIITIEEEELNVTVCGVYTYGKPVPGQVNIHVCRRYTDYGYESCQGRNLKALCEDFSGQADEEGCLAHVVKTKIFQLNREGYELGLRLTGTFTEEGTGVELVGTSKVDITSTLSTLELEKLDPHYKPGIPLFGQVRLLDGTRQPLANETVQIVVGPPEQRTHHVTNAEGRVLFALDTANFTGESVNFQVLYKLVATCYDRNWVLPSRQQVFRTIPRFYSPSKSYLTVQPVPGPLPCGRPQPVQVHYLLRPGALKERRLPFSHLVLAKGGIAQTGTHVLDLEHEGEAAKGVFSLDLAVGPDVAPLARLLVYTILPSGELVAHSADITVETCFRHKVTLRFSEPEALPGGQTSLRLSASPGSLCAVQAVDKSVFALKPEAELSPKTVYNLLPVKKLQGYYYGRHNLDEPDINPCIKLKNIEVDGFVYSPVPSHSAEPDAYSVLKDLGLKVFTSAKIHKPEVCSTYPVYEEHGRRVLAMPMTANLQAGQLGPGALPAPRPPGGTLETVRKSFPETWLWSLEHVPAPDASGAEAAVELPLTVPDTITEWKAGALCLSGEAGFGLAEGAFLRAFQPFFLHLTLPYSVVRGEAFVLRGTVFSYLPSCLRVRVTLAPSPDFEASPVGDVGESACLCRNGRKTVSWRLTPKSLGTVNITASAEALTSTELCGNEIVETPQQGRKDTVIKELLVEPEGVEKEAVFNSMLCAKEQAQSAPVSLKLPEKVVEGSARASFCVLGDLLGSAIQNLHQLLQLPYGCGEQNMALLAPNIYILDYLNETGQLTEEVRSKAIGYLTTGYQRQLNYKHADGSYSTFGERQREPGNTWLTAFVLKSLSKASRYIYVEEDHLAAARIALGARQKADGCFRGTGTLLNNALMGGVGAAGLSRQSPSDPWPDYDEDMFSAYVTLSLLEDAAPVFERRRQRRNPRDGDIGNEEREKRELGVEGSLPSRIAKLSQTNPVIRNALFCMGTMAQKATSPYTRALLAYAFSLAGEEDKRAELLRTLLAEAVKEEDGSTHWQWRQQEARKQEARAAPLTLYRPRAPSAEVELAGYVLLALLSKHPSPSQEELTAAAGIVKWLSKQQNPSGGFASTQDTVVALQALALYSSLTYQPGAAGGATVTLRSGESVLRQFQVDSANRLLLQCQALPAVPGDYSPEVTGTGCVYLQTALRYNVPPDQDDSHFALGVHTDPATCTGPTAHRIFYITINVSYTGQRPSSNMAVVDVKMLSGFIPVKSYVRQLQAPGRQVKRTEVTPSHVLLYLEQVSNVTQSFSFPVMRDLPVQGLKPAVVRVYDYYETDESAEAEYSAPCSAEGSQQGNA